MTRSLLTLFLLGCLPVPLGADEGMWLFNQPPRELLRKKYDIKLTDGWLARAQKASIRFNNGGSGSFISPDGLIVTNHHIGADSLQKLSKKGLDLHREGFLAKTAAEELKCPDLELNVLQEMVDVTERVQKAVSPDLAPAQALAARRAVLAQITKESLDKTGLRSDVVTLYHGGLFHLYRYKKYTDVRLVMAPEHAIAAFGGDTDNFEFPRYNLDVAFFRAYENGQPARVDHYFPWGMNGPSEGELVFVSGHPGTTNRLETLDRLRYRRDVLLPYTLQVLRYREALLHQYADQGPEQRRQALLDLYPVANARKALTGQYQGLLNPAVLKAKSTIEDDLRSHFERDSFQGKTVESPWKRIAEVQKKLAFLEVRYALLEKGDAFDSRLFRSARHLVRLADDLHLDDAKRLPEYRSSGLESLKIQLFSPAPISADLDMVKLAGSLSFAAEKLGGDDSVVLQLLDGKSPSQRAADLVKGCSLKDPGERQRLFQGGKEALMKSTDPMIQLARAIDATARKLRKDHNELEEIEQQAYAQLARALFDWKGTSVPPDATFTLRLAFGVVKGYQEDGKDIPFATRFAGAFERAKEQGNREPFHLPERWMAGRDKLDLSTPFNFVSTADTIGGNSGSPVLNRAGMLVGINFDRNRHGLSRNFVYTEEQARHIAVHSLSVLEALRKLYGAERLVQELIESSRQP